jgi:hypothetical protein
VLKGLSWCVSVLIQTRHRIERRCPHLDRQIIWCSCSLQHYFFQSSDTTRIWTVGSSDGANLVGLLCSVPSTPTLTSRVLLVHLTVPFPCFLASLTCFFASLFVVASMGPFLDNVVSPIACVSMNHQNQLKQMTNDNVVEHKI